MSNARDRFLADWLSLREEADHQARAAELVPPLQASQPDSRAWRILDLGSGSGSNLRYLFPRLRGKQHWMLTDHDTDLLSVAERSGQHIAAERSGQLAVDAQPMDLRDTRILAAALDAFQPDLVTASALLDLVSAAWLSDLVARITRHQCAALFALSVNGRFRLSPAAEDDGWMQSAFNRHQLQDGPFGATLGPGAVACAQHLFQIHGYASRLAPSPWQLQGHESADARLARALIAGRVAAVSELGSEHSARALAWWPSAEQRLLAGGQVTVGHFDLLAMPPRTGSLRI